ncbi:MAG: hypothetical protein JXQ83_07225, partial [Candidatus Glassbacteria bacterium]|nr:hypothetical protein [Candidatus Glassbacteria bacterium]
ETGAAEILVRETSHESQPCYCLCDYEVYGEITDLPAGTYTLVICGPGQDDQAKCSAVVNIQ